MDILNRLVLHNTIYAYAHKSNKLLTMITLKLSKNLNFTTLETNDVFT